MKGLNVTNTNAIVFDRKLGHNSPDKIGEGQEADGEDVVHHDYHEVSPNGLNVGTCINTVNIEANLSHVQPEDHRLHLYARIPGYKQTHTHTRGGRCGSSLVGGV